MTKHEFLEKLINKKDTWQVAMPIFREQNDIITMTEGICYQGAFQINIDGDVLFDCFVESLKGIVNPINEFISMKSPVIEYIIDPKQLKIGYIYEDRLICYYPGGSTEVDFRFMVREAVKEVALKPLIKEVPTKIRRLTNKVNIQLSKRTFGMDETIYLNIENETEKPRHIILECKQEFLTPNITEVFLNDQWTQEWYLKKTMIERLFGNLSFRNEPFKEIVIEGFIDSEAHASYKIKASVTIYAAYDTPDIISDDLMFNRTKISVYRDYIKGLVNTSSKKESSKLLDLIKACLNFNQQDLDLRLFYIWLLLEFGFKKESKSQMSLIEKYEDYYSSFKEYPVIKILKGIINNESSASMTIFDEINESSTWIELLAKARYTASRSNRYDFYKSLFQKGVRKSFLFAEVASLLNQLPIIPEEDDELYITTLKWAFNKKGVSSSWLNKLERHYYQVEKNPYMTSSLAMELYNLKKTKNFLRLFCQLCIREERYDHVALEAYTQALNSKLFIQELVTYYIYASWKTKAELDLELLTQVNKIQYLDQSVRDYIYLSVVKKRATYGLLFRRLNNEIMNHLNESKEYSLEIIQVVSIMFEEFVKNHNSIIITMITERNLMVMKDSKSGQELICQLFDFYMSKTCWIEETTKEQLMNKIINIVGFEGLSHMFENKETILAYYDQLNSHESLSGVFLDNHLFVDRHKSSDLLTRVYKKIIIDDFMDTLISHYFELNLEEKAKIQDIFFYYIGRRIVVGFEEVSDEFLEEMYSYYNSLKIKPAWLLLALSSGLNTTNMDLVNRIRKLYVEGQKHDIIVPWFNEDAFDENARIIHYLTHPNDEVTIFYRFSEDEEFQSQEMKHIAFGVFMYRIKLFYGEYFEYYILIKESDGSEYIPHSDLIINEKIPQNSLFIENEYSVEARIDNITLSYELNDDLSAKVFIKEQLEFDERIKRLLKV